jgi:outer membrane receptor protein involved in Fe transport
MTHRISAIVAGALLWTGLAAAQSTTGTISGKVMDAQSLAVPGVTVSVASPSLQGIRVVVTSENGDYIVPLLPSGSYTLSFELSGFQRVERQVNLAPTQTVPLEITLGPASVSETVQVTGRSADVLTQNTQVATNFNQELMRTLPTNGDLNAVLLMSPAVHPTGPRDGFSIAGAVSFESLFLINGVTVNENLRGQAQPLFIEDAIQETTVASGGVSAEFGRFTGGVVNVITKSGGNTFSGSLRDTLNNDKWRQLTPFEKDVITAGGRDARVDSVVPGYEYTIGGPIAKDRLWFFHAGRLQDQETSRTLAISNTPFVFTNEVQRFETKGTYAVSPGHRVQSSFTKVINRELNYTFNPAVVMDTRSLGTRSIPEELFTVNYTGVLSNQVFVEGRYSRRDLTFIGTGAKSTDLIEGTMLLDRSRGITRYWSDTFCGVCDPEQRDNTELFVKGSYFFSTRRAGSHAVAAGYDVFNDQRFANNHQSGSDYRIIGTTAIQVGSGEAVEFVPRFLGDGSSSIQWNPIPLGSQGSNFRTHSLFVNDSWRATERLTASLGLRWDRNDGADQAGRVTAKDGAFSPRLGVVWDPFGNQKWSVTGSVAKYVAAIANSVADASSPGGNSQTFSFPYTGPDINPASAAQLTPTPAAIRSVFDWFFANGGSSLPLAGPPTVPGITPQIRQSLASPSVWEYSGGVSRQFGARAAVRADATYRKWNNFYVDRRDMSTGRVQDQFGRTYDLALIENDNSGTVERQYSGLTTQATYRVGTVVDFGANYTLSRAWGNFEGESANSGPTRFTGLSNPEYIQESWGYPVGDLSLDQRHRSRLWINYRPSVLNGLTLSLLQALESGVPYGALSPTAVDLRAYVTNPGYVTPPTGTATSYYFTPRDAFRTEGQRRSDLSAHYVYRLPGGKGMQLFGQLQVINVFNQSQLCACGGTVFQNGGSVRLDRLDQTVLTPVTTPAAYQTFNPFTTTPVQGTNWDYGPNFGKALNRLAWTSPRQLRLSFGVRF